MENTVFWVQRGVSFEPPDLLFTAASEQTLRYFLQANPWANNLPIVSFGKKGTRIIADDSFPLHSVLGVEHLREFVGPVCDSHAITDKFLRVGRVAAIIASHAPAKPFPNVWEIAASASEGFLSVGIASARGSSVALSDSPPTMASFTLGDLMGVDFNIMEEKIEEQKASNLSPASSTPKTP